VTTLKEINNILRSWVKENPHKNIKALNGIRKNIKIDVKAGLYDQVGEVPQPGDNAYLLNHTDPGKIQHISNGEALVEYEDTDIAHHVELSKLVKNEKEFRWEYKEGDYQPD